MMRLPPLKLGLFAGVLALPLLQACQQKAVRPAIASAPCECDRERTQVNNDRLAGFVDEQIAKRESTLAVTTERIAAYRAAGYWSGEHPLSTALGGKKRLEWEITYWQDIRKEVFGCGAQP
jgi:hypothetical protein